MRKLNSISECLPRMRNTSFRNVNKQYHFNWCDCRKLQHAERCIHVEHNATFTWNGVVEISHRANDTHEFLINRFTTRNSSTSKRFLFSLRLIVRHELINIVSVRYGSDRRPEIVTSADKMKKKTSSTNHKFKLIESKVEDYERIRTERHGTQCKSNNQR